MSNVSPEQFLSNRQLRIDCYTRRASRLFAGHWKFKAEQDTSALKGHVFQQMDNPWIFSAEKCCTERLRKMTRE